MAALDKNKLLDSANKFIAKNQFDKAIKDLQRILEADPKNNQVALKIAELFLKLEQKEEAVKYYDFAANLFKQNGFYDKAIAVYRQVMSINPTLPTIYMKLAELFTKKNLGADAMSHYKTAIALYEKEGKITEALQILQRLTEIEPSNLAGKMKLSELYIKNGMKDKAYTELSNIAQKLIEAKKVIDLITVYEKMLIVKPGEISVLKQLIKLYLKRGDYQKVLLKVKEIINLSKSDSEVLLALAKAYAALEKYPLAINAYKEVAKLYTKEGLKNEAVDIYKKVLELDPSDEQALQTVIGSSLPKNSSPEADTEIHAEPIESREPLKPAADNLIKQADDIKQKKVTEDTEKGSGTSLSGEDIEKFFSEAQVYKRYGLNAKAIEKLNQILTISSGNRIALIELFELYIQGKKFIEASGIAEKLYNVFINDGDIDKAEEYVRRALENDPENDLLRALAGFSSPSGKEDGSEKTKVEKVNPGTEDIEIERSTQTQKELKIKEETAQQISKEQKQSSSVESKDINTDIEFEVEIDHNEAPVKQMEDIANRIENNMNEQSIHASEQPQHLIEESLPIPEEIEFTPEFSDIHQEQKTAGDNKPGEEVDFNFSEDELKEIGAVSSADIVNLKEPEVGSDALDHGSNIDILDSLDEAEFYRQQGLLTEAKHILEKIMTAYPNEERSKAMYNDIIDKEKTVPEEQTVIEEGEPFIGYEARHVVSVSSSDELFDLAQALENELSQTAASSEEPAAIKEEEQQVSVEEVLEAFKRGVEKTVDKEDAETHYNLGIAYKEMGLIDEAINEFNIAIGSPQKKADGLIMLGMSYMGKGLPGKAIDAYLQALDTKGGVSPENKGLIYELALAYEAYGDMKSAYKSYEDVSKMDESFRDAKEKLNKLSEFVKVDQIDLHENDKEQKKEVFTLESIMKPETLSEDHIMPDSGTNNEPIQQYNPLPDKSTKIEESGVIQNKKEDNIKQTKKKVSYI
ncbi:MAG: tetratricopeptide repeat protein [Deltaproteobacteria bacterium]|nr:tetratricopeptide repeat protein [Deltaproteobacteria bacterium]MCL5792236.1 tetratricopeptide repeat protein [Deltaproteobacteria bacterium]